MNCCDHKCTEGHGCPVRRVRAGGPPPADLPTPQQPDPEEANDRLELAADFAAFTLFAVFVLAVIFFLSAAAGYWSAR